MVVSFVVEREVFFVVETMGLFVLKVVFLVGLDVVVALFVVIGVPRFAVLLEVDGGIATFNGVGVGFNVARLGVDFDVFEGGILMAVDEF